MYRTQKWRWVASRKKVVNPSKESFTEAHNLSLWYFCNKLFCLNLILRELIPIRNTLCVELIVFHRAEHSEALCLAFQSWKSICHWHKECINCIENCNNDGFCLNMFRPISPGKRLTKDVQPLLFLKEVLTKVPVSYRNYGGCKMRKLVFEVANARLTIRFSFNFSPDTTVRNALKNCFCSAWLLTGLILNTANAAALINFNGCFYY